MNKLFKKITIKLGVGVCLLQPLFNLAPVMAQENLPQLKSQAGMVIDATNGQVLFESNAKKNIEAASITKLLTVYLTYKAIDEGKLSLDTKVSISDKAYAVSQDYNIANVPLRQDLQYKVGDLIESIGITLANGSSIALAEKVAGSEEKFVQQMNQQLKDWGVQEADLINATGLKDGYTPQDKESIQIGKENKLSAEAVAVIAYHLVSDYPEYLKSSKTLKKFFQQGTDDEFEMTNYNSMLPTRQAAYEGVDGLTIGTSSSASEHAVITTTRNDFRVISIVLGAPDSQTRYSETADMLDYVYSAYMKEHVVSKGEIMTQTGIIQTANGRDKTIRPCFGQDLDLIVPIIDTSPRMDYSFKGNSSKFNSQGKLIAPLKAKEAIGIATISAKGSQVRYLPSARANKVVVLVNTELKKAHWYQRIWRFFANIFSAIKEFLRQFFTGIFN